MKIIGLEILVIILLLAANGMLAMSEMAIVSARRARLQQRVAKGDGRARIALELAAEPNHFLSTVQIGITLVGVLAGAFGGATLAEQLANYFKHIPTLAPYSETIGLSIVVVAITYLSLVLGELVPKRLALNNPEVIASAIASPMRWLSKWTSPVVYLLSASTDAVLRALRIQPPAEPTITEEEIKIMIQQGAQAGSLAEAERTMVEGVFRLGDRRVGAVMTPRQDIVWLKLDDSLEEIRRKITDSAYSRFPVGHGSLDNVVGIVQTKDLLVETLRQQPVDLNAVLRHPIFVPETVTALQLLNLFKKSPMHIALVVDEHGSLQGLVTLNDVLEAIVGALPSDQSAEPQVVPRDDGSWLIDGMMLADEFKHLFGIDRLPAEEKGYYQTLSGFVMVYLGRVPMTSDHFEWNGLRFEVVDMDGRRVDKLLVSPIKATTPSKQ